MYRIQGPETIQFLMGRTLRGLLVARLQVEFHFDKNVSIACNHMLLLVEPEGIESWVCVDDGTDVFAPQFPPALFRLIESAVQGVRVSQDNRDLTLVFENSAELTFSGDCEMYECYHIYNGDQRLII